uniref:Cytochrome c oxidase subunit 3 n=1 Tax=Mecistocephalus marmoratus TaxID=980230 RepID=A0A4Y1K7W8_9MYRI|nr:cytochrome c oxidase subunit III [Mecistocephalus marmoratus]ARU77309.1 cytochrome c oxidase subunit III [Mecistocephalus marmoratus]
MSTYSHPFHIVDQSPWPLTGAIAAFTTMSGMIMWFHMYSSTLLMLGTGIMILTMYQWWRDITREGAMQGHHTSPVTYGLRWGMILFIISEVFFFVSFFWAFFHSSLAPTPEIGAFWPPTSIIPFNPFQIPLLNTAVLLSSGITVTWAHHSLMENNHAQAKHALIITVLLGMYFSVLQAFEYIEAPFTIADATYGSTFYMATGFHGLHVLIGTSFLLITLLRHLKSHFSSHHHFGFEAAAWYWHFVDVVWLFLYVSIYWWGG